ncbi:LysR family transcriptional regulator [Corynebacterium suranareeae]|uniref:LysR family transcriptional regulator n=1 Tax=Corynebacterium suranareeae TaxID=2506452 RepID=A0A160PR47_9CORY|nr:LysR family transcriptional regulator [Corynebacterium suranareeae]BAU96647.1 LysR family transcriptional regulator [Corynebacterium suranareeae]
MRIDRITLDQLRIITAIAEHGGFSRAAEFLNQSQSNLSRTASLVERHVGVKLFDRTTRHFSLTDEGVQFVQMARNILEFHKRETNYFQDYVRGVNGVLRIATLPSLAATFLPSLIVKFRAQFPDVRVEVTDFTAEEVLSRAVEGTIDLSITAIDADYVRDQSNRFDLEPLATEEFFCIVPSEHNFAQQEEVSWAQLREEPFVSFGESSSVRRIVDRALYGNDIQPSQIVTARSVSSVAGMCAAGIGLSAAPGFVLPLMNVQGLVFKPFTGVPITRTIGLVTPKEKTLSKPAIAFKELLSRIDPQDLRLPPRTLWHGLDVCEHL